MKKKCILVIIGIFLMSFNAFSDSTIQDNKEVLTEITPGSAKIVSGYKGAKEEIKRPFKKADILKEKKSRLNELNKLLNIGENIKTNTWNKRKQELSIAD